MRTVVEGIGSHYTPTASTLRLSLLSWKPPKKDTGPQITLDPKFKAPPVDWIQLTPGSGPAPFSMMTLEQLLGREYLNYLEIPSSRGKEPGGSGDKKSDLPPMGPRVTPGRGKQAAVVEKTNSSRNWEGITEMTKGTLADAMEGEGP